MTWLIFDLVRKIGNQNQSIDRFFLPKMSVGVCLFHKPIYLEIWPLGHDSFIHVTSLIHVWHDSFIHVTWLIHMWHAPRMQGHVFFCVTGFEKMGPFLCTPNDWSNTIVQCLSIQMDKYLQTFHRAFRKLDGLWMNCKIWLAKEACKIMVLFARWSIENSNIIIAYRQSMIRVMAASWQRFCAHRSAGPIRRRGSQK